MGTGRYDVEQRLLSRHRELAAGVVLAAVGRAVRRAGATRGPTDWLEIEQTAEEQLLLRQTMRALGQT